MMNEAEIAKYLDAARYREALAEVAAKMRGIRGVTGGNYSQAQLIKLLNTFTRVFYDVELMIFKTLDPFPKTPTKPTPFGKKKD